MYELEDRRFAGSEMIVSRPKSAKRARQDWSISMLALIGTLGKLEEWYQLSKTHPLDIPVDHPLAMDVDQPPSSISQLDKLFDHW